MSRTLSGLTLAVSAAIALAGSHAQAQPAKFTRDNIHVKPAVDVVGTGKVQIDVGQPLILTLLNDRTALAFVDKGAQIRLFRLSDKGELVKWTEFNPCSIYLTTIWPLFHRNGRILNFGPLNLTWLNPIEGKRLAAGRWLLVFEDGLDDHDVLRINNADVTAYRAMGLELTVETGGHAYDISQVRPLSPEEALASQAQIAGANSNSAVYACMYLTAKTSPSTGELASLERCDNQQIAPGRSINDSPHG